MHEHFADAAESESRDNAAVVAEGCACAMDRSARSRIHPFGESPGVERSSRRSATIYQSCIFYESYSVAGCMVYSPSSYDRSRIDDDAAGRMLGHLRTLLEGMATNPEQKVGELPLLTSSEHHRLLEDWNQTEVDYPRDKCVHQLFEAQAERTP